MSLMLIAEPGLFQRFRVCSAINIVCSLTSEGEPGSGEIKNCTQNEEAFHSERKRYRRSRNHQQ